MKGLGGGWGLGCRTVVYTPPLTPPGLRPVWSQRYPHGGVYLVPGGWQLPGGGLFLALLKSPVLSRVRNLMSVSVMHTHTHTHPRLKLVALLQ